MQLQAAAAEQQHQNDDNNHSNNGNSNSGDYNHTSISYQLQCVPELPECYVLEGDATSTELVNVANKDCDSLAKLAYNLYKLAKDDHIVIDRKRNEVVRTNALTHQKTIYRCMDPIGMGMGMGMGEQQSVPTKAKAVRTTRRRASPYAASPLPKRSSTTFRTRSGRLVCALQPDPTAACQPVAQLVSELQDKDYRAAISNATAVTEAEIEPVIEAPRMPRAVPPNAICPGCQKIFLGRRLQQHFVKFPEHMPSVQQQQQQQQTHQSTLFGLLTTQLQRHSHLNEEQRADLFLHELNDFVQQLQLRSQRLIRNTSGMHFVNSRIARVLGIPEGQYALDMSAMESAQAPTPEPELQLQLMHSHALPSTRNLVDYPGLSMSMDDTLTDEAAQRLNLSAGGKLLPPSEESLLRNVGDLMQPPVAVPDLPPHYDHASDNAVEALNMKETPDAAILDLNVEFFQFNNN
ncbi:CG13005 [Drosophila busckii]|uniref:CG13005 n=2 Tax=Drosophila busckii TaxID=30019 RepID=A0A0M4F9A3_DROBS|nr:CG13005 [Drosophila busckii]